MPTVDLTLTAHGQVTLVHRTPRAGLFDSRPVEIYESTFGSIATLLENLDLPSSPGRRYRVTIEPLLTPTPETDDD